MPTSIEAPAPEAPADASPPAPSPKALARKRMMKRVLLPFKILGAIAALVIVVPGAAYVYPPLVGMDHAYVVLSGSMVPVFDPGDVIWVKDVDPEAVPNGTIITFQASPGSKTLFTHRVIEVITDGGHVRYLTKGDANEDPDPMLVKPPTIIGAYEFHIPKWGYLLQFFRSKIGFFLLVATPGALILGTELVKLYKELDKWDRERQAKKKAKEGKA